jgi:hypothetical protein
MRKSLWIVIASLALVLSLPAAAAQGKPKGKGKPEDKGKPAAQAEKGKAKEKAEKEKKKEKEMETEEEREREREASHGRAFGKEHQKKIRDYFGNSANLEGLPPGLAKREELPPGLQRHLERNGTLPPGLQKRLQPLPQDLEAQLPTTPEGIVRGVIGNKVVVVEERTSKILDIVDGVFGGGRARDETGVRRTQ